MDQKLLKTTLPDGREATFAELSVKGIEQLNAIVRKVYWDGVTLATAGMEETSANRLRLAALHDSAQLSAIYGTGRHILMQSPCGLGREIYVMMQTPQMSFEEFCTMFYDGFSLTADGLALFTKVMDEFRPLTNETVQELHNVLEVLDGLNESQMAETKSDSDATIDEANQVADVDSEASTETITG